MELLQKVIAQAHLFDVPAKDAVTMLLTLGGRIPIENRTPALAPFDRTIFDLLPGSVRLTPTPANNGENLHLYLNWLGRLHIRRICDEPIDYGGEREIQIGYLALEPDILKKASAAADQVNHQEGLVRRELDRVLTEEERAGQLPALLDAIEDSVRHVEAICFYVDDRLYAVMERGTNLITTRKRTGLIDELRSKPVATWRSADRLAIVAMRALFLSGRSIRFEEFNSIELTARRLQQLLHRLGAVYAEAHSVRFKPPSHPFELGRKVGELAQALDSANWLRYRVVSGITFGKHEHCVRLTSDQRIDRIMRTCLEQMRSRWHCTETDDPQFFFSEVANGAIEATCQKQRTGSGDDGKPATTPLERLIEDVVSSAVLCTSADYGMSSSLRRPHEVVGHERDALPTLLMELTPKDFYCCIVGSSFLSRRFGSRLTNDVFRAVQARMQFNRWHFIVGNLPRDAISDDRHYFYPPTMPDLAEWVDQFHAGHIRAAVRHSIRSPGPEILDFPLRISGHEFRGFYDVRVVRIEGAPFTIEDLRLVRAHNAWMGHIWRTILARCADVTGKQLVEITGFENGNGAILETDSLSKIA
jgi:hypothetical protein